MNEENIPSPTGIKWNNITIFKILKQEKYIGDIRWQKTYSVFMGKKWLINHGEQESYYIRDALPAIISRDDFMKAQELREKMPENRTKQQNHRSEGKQNAPADGHIISSPKAKRRFGNAPANMTLQDHV